MEYILIFLEGIITFISPCMLPMLPIYISYFAGRDDSKSSKIVTVLNAVCFVIGFSIVFTALGVFSATLGTFLKNNNRIVNIILGIIIVIFGVNFMDIIKIPVINNTKGIKVNINKYNCVSSFILGVVFSITWSPCVGAFLGTALSIILVNGNVLKGTILIFIYCLGLGIPFVISAALIDRLKNTFDYLKKHYLLITRVCGAFLCVIGILMMTGTIDKYFMLVM